MATGESGRGYMNPPGGEPPRWGSAFLCVGAFGAPLLGGGRDGTGTREGAASRVREWRIGRPMTACALTSIASAQTGVPDGVDAARRGGGPRAGRAMRLAIVLQPERWSVRVIPEYRWWLGD